jgi:hypothetical protein
VRLLNWKRNKGKECTFQTREVLLLVECAGAWQQGKRGTHEGEQKENESKQEEKKRKKTGLKLLLVGSKLV